MSDEKKLEQLIAEAASAENTFVPPLPRRSWRRWRSFGLGTLLAISVAALAAGWMWEERVSGPDERALEEGKRLALSIAAQMIRDYARRNGRYPDALGEAVPLPFELRYRKLADGFELTAPDPGGRTVIVRER